MNLSSLKFIVASLSMWIGLGAFVYAQQVCTQSDFYLANTTAMSAPVQKLLNDRQELVNHAERLRQAGLGFEYQVTLKRIREQDTKIHGEIRRQAEQEMTLARDPRRLAQLASQDSGMDIKIRPRTDCRFDIEIQGVIRHQGLTEAEVVSILTKIR